MNGNMTYEGFIRAAFSVKSNELIDRYGDIAQLANTDVFDLSRSDLNYLNKAKAAVAYSIAIYNNEIFEIEEVNEVDRISMENLLNDALNCTNSQELLETIQTYKTYRDRYFTHIWNE